MGFTGKRFKYVTVEVKITKWARIKNYLENVLEALKGSMRRTKLYDFESKLVEDPEGDIEEFIYKSPALCYADLKKE
jgi:hypothetical protein